MSLPGVIEAPVKIADAIKRASQATGTDFNYLLKTAARESSFNTSAKAKTSSASGLFQFIENTWLKTVKEEGHQFGLGQYADKIFKTDSGKYYVPRASQRQEILALRNDPEISAMIAGAFTRQNADYVSAKLGRDPTQGELYMAHFLGAKGAARFIELAGERPNAPADSYFPKAARANRAIFYEGGKARSLSQVYAGLVSKHGPAQIVAGDTRAPALAPDLPERNPARAAQPAEALPPLREIKVAALSPSRLQITPGTMTDIGFGSIGEWQTIVRPELESVGPEPQVAAAEPNLGVAAVAKSKPVAPELPTRKPKRPVAVRPEPAPALSTKQPPAPKRNAEGPLKIASAAFDYFQDDYWREMSMSGS